MDKKQTYMTPATSLYRLRYSELDRLEKTIVQRFMLDQFNIKTEEEIIKKLADLAYYHGEIGIPWILLSSI